MADARTPPSGPPARDPTAPARLLDAAAEVGLRVERAQRDLEGLAGTTERLAGAMGVPPRSPGPGGSGGRRAGGPDTEARALAIDLAVGGATRDVIDEQLRRRFGQDDLAALVARSAPAGATPPAAGGSRAQPRAERRVAMPQEARSAVRSRGYTPHMGGGSPAPGAAGESASAGDDPEGDLPGPLEGGPSEDTVSGPERAAASARPPSRGMLPAALQTYGSQIAMAALSLVNALIVARTVGPQGRGEVVYLTVTAFLGANIWTLGVQEANVNLVGSEPETRGSLATNSLILSAVFGVLGGLLMAVLVVLVPAAGAGISWTLLALVFASLPMLVLNAYLRFLIQGDFGFGVTNLAWVLPAVVNVIVNTALAAFGVLTVGTSVLTWIAGQTIATGILVWWVLRRSGGFGRPDAALARRTLRFGVKSHVGRIMLLANYRVDQWLLGAIAGTKQLGHYSVAVAWAEGLFLLPTALSAVQRPSVVRASRAGAVRITARVFRLSLLITAVFAAALAVLAPFLCVTVFGEEFRPAIEPLRILAAGAFGVVALKQLGNSLTGRDRPLQASLSIGIAFVITIALDILLIPEYGANGAAVASSVAYTLGGLVIAVVFARSLGGRLRDLVPRPSDLREVWSTGRLVVRRRAAAEPESGASGSTR